MLSLKRYYRNKWTTKNYRKIVGAHAPIAISAEDKTQRLYCLKLIEKNQFFGDFRKSFTRLASIKSQAQRHKEDRPGSFSLGFVVGVRL